ncbi:hypothetical protein A2316_01795 [Candidatus Falkowbacteria bacterium RIFOXYB2_FULL_38_15]|uniref:Uncharacterized protein n=1 Tax=Candidatus Falkowbacteria bacterium RIFOXYA2_FULL_38_12 TaxID=1797993 RepID=A0A1F5S2B9_9BACT|nr:MAG: hypothetical protein A2257_03575 [Candidatus Falkowbacteria bacterium RIFOXYA2_FULL_38_12]OGF32684.1 MAG: hypothetical protein A2316_01795 [Candidatus Falkowbacteria bacterium RIFOXYB2_FULL_38_15]OGF42088.1 MAG: hypothetical protein A2555_01690 [Candidatus Falkowbacteria bacterium RIFOXYD2_FULL_39_16]
MRTKREKISIIVLVFIIIFAALLTAFFVLNGPESCSIVLDDYFRERRAKDFYGSQGQKYYNYMPKDIMEKHRNTIKAVDEIMKKGNMNGYTSDNDHFDLNTYVHLIQVGVVPYISKEDPLLKKVNELIGDILDRITIKNKI